MIASVGVTAGDLLRALCNGYEYSSLSVEERENILLYGAKGLDDEMSVKSCPPLQPQRITVVVVTAAEDQHVFFFLLFALTPERHSLSFRE